MRALGCIASEPASEGLLKLEQPARRAFGDLGPPKRRTSKSEPTEPGSGDRHRGWPTGGRTRASSASANCRPADQATHGRGRSRQRPFPRRRKEQRALRRARADETVSTVWPRSALSLRCSVICIGCSAQAATTSATVVERPASAHRRGRSSPGAARQGSVPRRRGSATAAGAFDAQARARGATVGEADRFRKRGIVALLLRKEARLVAQRLPASTCRPRRYRDDQRTQFRRKYLLISTHHLVRRSGGSCAANRDPPRPSTRRTSSWIKPTAGARPASPCTLGRFILQATRTSGPTPEKLQTARATQAGNG